MTNDDKKRIVFIINQLFKGGAETALVNLLKALSPENYAIDVIITDQIYVENAISLIPEIPEYINIINILEESNKYRLASRSAASYKIYRKFFKEKEQKRSIKKYLSDKKYDVAISYGEWISSEPVACWVNARYKYVWIHADIDKIPFVHPDVYRLYKYFDNYIYPSRNSLCAAEKAIPYLKGKGAVVNNLVDDNSVVALSEEQTDFSIEADGRKILVTVANLRIEKNHIKQIKIAEKLKKDGIDFLWLNIGDDSATEYVEKIKASIKESGLESEFLLLGAKKNPFPYMRIADAVCVLSDGESWSMVITEAKILGIPVVATKTSGAIEQLSDGSGILCDFDIDDITGKIEDLLENNETKRTAQARLEHFSSKQSTLEQLEPLLNNNRKRIVMIFDDINYMSGARNAMLSQAGLLQSMAQVSLLSMTDCQDSTVLDEYNVKCIFDDEMTRCLSTPTKEVLLSKTFGYREKGIKLVNSILFRIHLSNKLIGSLIKEELSNHLKSYDIVCVTSEASAARAFISSLENIKKIQWIHTDYSEWREFSDWTRSVTKNDFAVLSRFDDIVCLSEGIKKKLISIYPDFAKKTWAIPNIIQNKDILVRSKEPLRIDINPNKNNIITIGRIEPEKRYDKIVNVARDLKDRGFEFHWYIIGDGNLYEKIRELCNDLISEGFISMMGKLENPLPVMKACDLLVLLSDYEGTPVTIDEAKVLGVQVLATDVGGISDQLKGGFGNVVPKNQTADYYSDEIIKCCKNRHGNVHEKVSNDETIMKIKKLYDL